MQRSVVFLFATLAFAVQNDSIFHSTTQLVRIDVAAEDKNGQPVTDLAKDDFELKVNGNPQSIDTFTATSAIPEPPVELPPGMFTNKQAAVEVARGRYIVFLLDWRNTNWQLQPWSHQQLQKLLAEAPPDGKVALYLLNEGFQIVQDFTSDRELLKEKAGSLSGAVPSPSEGRASETIQAFGDIARHLAGISGQKVLIWVSQGFPDKPASPPQAIDPVSGFSKGPPDTSGLQDIDKAVRILANANIVVESAEPRYLGANIRSEFGPTATFVNPLQMIAERTGGRFFPGDNNDFASTLRDAANDRATSYEIGFYAGEGYRPGLVPIDIRSRRPGITLRYREGFYVEKDQPVKPVTVRDEAQDVLERAVDATGIPLTVAASRTPGNVGTIKVIVNIDARALTLQQDGNLWRGKASVLTRFASDVEDQVGDIPLDAPAFNLTPEQYDRALREGIRLRFTMKKPPDAVTLRVLVRDEDSGNTGTVTIPIDDLPQNPSR